jgi:DNA mismatch repair protein MutS
MSSATLVPEYLKLTEYWKKEKGEKTLVLMEVGTFFEIYGLKDDDGKYSGSNIEDVHKITGLAIGYKTGQKYMNIPVVQAGFHPPQVEKYVNMLQDNGYTCVIYTQDFPGKNPPRSLSEIISPGTFFTDESKEITNTSICLWFQHSSKNKYTKELLVIGCATIDIFTGKTTIFETQIPYYHNPCTYDEIEKLVSVYQPKECIIVSNLSNKITNDIINFIGLDDTKKHIVDISTLTSERENDTKMDVRVKNSEKQIYQIDIFNKFYENLSNEIIVTNFIQEHCLAVQAFVVLIDFVFEYSPNLTKKLDIPIVESHSDKLVLANHSLQQLNILDDSRYSGKLRSVSSFLNNCQTVMGKREFKYNLHHPITNIDTLNKSYNVTEHVLETGEWSAYRHELTNIHDLEKLKRKIIIQKATPYDIATIYTDCITIKKLAENACSLDEPIAHEAACFKGDPIVATKKICDEFIKIFNIEMCSKINDLSVEKLNNHDIQNLCFVKYGINDKIDNLLNDCINSKNKLKAIITTLSEIIGITEKTRTNNSEVSYIKIHETSNSDPLLIGTKRRIKFLKSNILTIQNKIKNISYCDNNNQVEVFELDLSSITSHSIGSNKKDESVINPLIAELTRKIQKSNDELIFELITFFKDWICNFSNIEDIDIVSSYTTQIDLLQCKAYIADMYNYCKPVIIPSNKSYISFEDIRHPLIEHIQTDELYVANDLTIGNGEKMDGLLLFGTNAVGKTSFIKSVGIAVIMAQAGLFVPCKSFVYHPYSCIYTRILGNDNLFKGLSTFAVEMSELRTILNMADENSLVLGDELCSGTESDSALSIFTAGLEHLHSVQSTFLFATHFHEVIHYDEIKSLDRLKLMHMEVFYNEATKELEYGRKLKDGAGESMYGLEVCKSLNLPEDFLQRALNIRLKYNKEQQGVLTQASSHYNAKKIKGNCEICKLNRATEMHHLQHQSHANNRNYIDTFHKNHPANLIRICEDCHNQIHKSAEEHRIVKTTNGYRLAVLE